MQEPGPSAPTSERSSYHLQLICNELHLLQRYYAHGSKLPLRDRRLAINSTPVIPSNKSMLTYAFPQLPPKPQD